MQNKNTQLSLSVIIPVFNGEETIENCIRSVKNQSITPEEIVVVDDCSYDSTHEKLQKISGIKIISHEKNKGVSSARNSGFRASSGNIVVFIDSDTVLEENFLEILVEKFESRHDVSAIGGEEYTVTKTGYANRFRSLYLSNKFNFKTDTETRVLFGIAMAFRRECLLDIGLFDESFVPTGGEDVDICLRIYNARYKLLYVPNLKVYHYRNDSVKSLVRTGYRYSVLGRKAFAKNQTNVGIRLDSLTRRRLPHNIIDLPLYILILSVEVLALLTTLNR